MIGKPDIILGTVLICEADSYLITISAIRPATLYYLLGQYHLIQEVNPLLVSGSQCHL